MTGLQGVTAMDDIRINAEKRAANPSTAPAGAAFETERQKQKAALVRQLDELDPSRVRKISAYSETQLKKRPSEVFLTVPGVSSDTFNFTLSDGI